MSAKIVYRLENIRLWKEKSTRKKLLVENGGLLLHPKFQDTYFCFSRDSAPQFRKACACIASPSRKCEKCHFASSARPVEDTNLIALFWHHGLLFMSVTITAHADSRRVSQVWLRFWITSMASIPVIRFASLKFRLKWVLNSIVGPSSAAGPPALANPKPASLHTWHGRKSKILLKIPTQPPRPGQPEARLKQLKWIGPDEFKEIAGNCKEPWTLICLQFQNPQVPPLAPPFVSFWFVASCFWRSLTLSFQFQWQATRALLRTISRHSNLFLACNESLTIINS